MPYLNLDLDYFSHPKVMRLMGWLGFDAVVYPIKLWCYAGRYHQEKGIFDNYSPTEVETVLGWHGENGKLVDALVKFNFIEKTATGYMIHDWIDHAGHLAVFKKRAKTAAKQRWKAYATSNAKRTDKQCYTNAPNHLILTIPNLTIPSHTKEDISTEVSPKPSVVPKSAAAWEAYRGAYRCRYGVDPVRNKTVNSGLCQVVDKLGAEDAPKVCGYYLTHPGQFYTTAMHPVSLLVRDAEKLRTEWATGVQMTLAQARQDDGKANRGQMWSRLIAKEEAKTKESEGLV